MIYQLEKVDRVINKVVTDLGLGSNEIPFYDFIEWVADALQHIGSHYQYVEKETYLMIENYEALLPCDFYKPIRKKLGRACSIESSGGFYGGTLAETLKKCGICYDELSAYDRFVILPVQGISKPSNLIDESINRLQYNGNLIGNVTANKFTELDYNINLNKITTSFKDGIIELQYLSFPVDERGFPLVPDDISFREALFWRCAMQISMRNPKCLPNPQLQNYEYCRQMWNRYCAQARASANMPSLEMIERIKNNWLSMRPIYNMENNEYRALGKQQRIDLDGGY
jgi:hypothetical protein